MTSTPHELPHEPRTERVAWVLFGALMIVSVIGLFAPRDSTASETATGAGDATSTEPVNGAADSPADTGPAVTEPASERFTISASGDILIHERVADAARRGDGWDFTGLFQNVKPHVERADVAICHLEVPLSSANDDLAFGAEGVFRAPNQLADALVDTGFDFCSVASNHAFDNGEASVISTVEQLRRVGLPHTGIATNDEEANTLWRTNVNGVTVGHLSYTYGLNGREPGEVPQNRVAQIDLPKIIADAQRHGDATDFLVVSLHWGDEWTTELNDLQRTLGPTLIASPFIDLIIGHSAHLPQRIDEVDGEYIAYGLGNFLSNQSPDAPECPSCPVESQDGVLVEFVVDRDENGELAVVEVAAIPTWVDVGGTWQIFDTTAEAPISGAEADPEVLAASAKRTLATLGLPGE